MSADWTMALVIYLGVGGLILAVIYVHHRLTTTERSDWVNAALRASDPERHTLRYRILADAVAPTLAAYGSLSRGEPTSLAQIAAATDACDVGS